MEERNPELEQAIKTAAKMIIEQAMNMLYADNHYFGERPCSTCRAITGLIGFKFGCVRYAAEREKKVTA